MGRVTEPMEAVTLAAAAPAPLVQGQILSGQAPVELFLKTEPEAAGRPGKTGQAPTGTPARSEQTSAASEHRDTKAVSKPAAAEQETIPPAVRTAARDIRMGREIRPAETISPATVSPAPQTQRQALPGQPTVELSLRTEPEASGEAAAPVPGRQTAQAIPVARRTAPQSAGPVPVHRTARDIRMQSHPFQRPADGSEIRSSVTQLGPRAAAAGPETETWSPAPTELTLGTQGGSGETVTAAGTFSAGRTGWTEAQPEPVPLTYGPGQQQATQTPPQETAPSSGYRESEYVRSLPEWARNFLRSSADPQAAKTMGVARDISALQAPPAEEDVQWTAPNYRPPEAPIAYREKKREAAPRAVEEVRISEAEIQRTADRVYRIIEDRIRLERHRLGL